MARGSHRRWTTGAVLFVLVLGGGVFAWRLYQEPEAGANGLLASIRDGISELYRYIREPVLPEGFASGNGRIEAQEIDVATKFHARISEVLVDEGDTVEAGQVAARMDAVSFEAQFREARARAVQAEKEWNSAAAVVRQRENECALAEKDLKRSRAIYGEDPGAIAVESLDRDTTAALRAQAACAVAEAELAEAEAAIRAAVAETERV